MSNNEQAFFAAYRPSDHSLGKSGQRQRRATKQPGSAGSSAVHPSGKTVEAEYCDVTWYRVDAPHAVAEVPAKPAVQATEPVPPRRVPEPHSATVGYENVNPTWDASCLIVTSSFTTETSPAALSPAAPAPAREASTARQSVTSAPHYAPPAYAPPKPVEVMTRPSTAPTARQSTVEVESTEDVEEELHKPVPSVVPARPVRSPVPVTKSESVAEVAEVEMDRDDLQESAEDVATDTEQPAWKAGWEVDEFVWPAETERLYESQRDYFRYAGEKLCDASREGLRVLAVTATREKEGCTTMAICLARAAAAAGARVALIDSNLAHPELGYKLGLEFARGWQESLDVSPLNESAVLSLQDGLTVLPLSAAHRLSTLNEPGVSRVFHEAAQAFDLIITDMGSLPTGEGHCFEPGEGCPIHAALIIRDMRRTSETETLVTASRLKTLGLAAIGIAENFVPQPPAQSAAA